MCPTGERLEHLRGFLRPARLSEHELAAADDRVDAEHGSTAAVDGTRLAGSVLKGVVAELLVIRGDNIERNAQLLEDRLPLRGRGGEQKRRRGRRAHSTLRA